jgi:hypothetical protein
VSRADAVARVGRASQPQIQSRATRVLLPVGLLLAAIGYYGPWITHGTAALTLGGVDMGEFVKFLPAILSGSVHVARQAFYLPPLAIVVAVALAAGSRSLHYPWPLQVLMLVLAVPISLQLLPPAWSPASLTAAEFRLQTLALAISWLLLAGFWLLGRVPVRLSGLLGATLAVTAASVAAWQFLLVKPAIDAVYQNPPASGWGVYLCMAGLAILAAANLSLVLRPPPRSGEQEETWPSS